MRSIFLALSLALAAASCSEDTTAALSPDDPAVEMAVGERRVVDVRFLRFDVQGFVKEHNLEQLRAMPRTVLEDIWLLDLDIRPLLTNALQSLRELPPDDVADLPLSARNMHTLLTMTPDNANLDGTNLEELIGLSAGVGLPPARALANLLAVGVSDDFIPIDAVAQAMLTNVVGTHPAAQFRGGPVDAEHPDGRYAVAPNSIPVTLADVITNFENMAERFGPTGEHPGFVLEAYGVSIVEDEFKMISTVNVNALPYKGVDLTDGTVASVNSTGSQVELLHDFSNPNWLQIVGLADDPTVERLTFAMRENDDFVPGGTAREPAGQGDSPAWDLPKWEFEHLIAEMSRLTAADIPAHCDTYQLGTGADAFTACMDETGWVTLETFNNAGSPPEPAYLWDLNLEIAQTRLHDGGLAEGEADIELTVRNVAVGVSADVMAEQARANIRANLQVLREFTSLITNNTVGDADFYYYQSDSGEDWLYFVAETDLRRDDKGAPVRGYDYESPGFFRSADLSKKISSTGDVDGDIEHEKVRVVPGDTVYVADDSGRVYEIAIGDKTNRSWLRLELTRTR